MKIKVHRMVQLLADPRSIEEQLNTYAHQGFLALCVVDLRTAQGAEQAQRYVERAGLPMCIVPGATVSTNDGNLHIVYGAVDKVVVPSGLSLEALQRLAGAHGGFVAPFPARPDAVEIEVDGVNQEDIIRALPRDTPQSVFGPQTFTKAQVACAPDPVKWPSVTIVIPVFNAPELLGRCLNTLGLTDYPGHWNVQIVDNASTDKQTLKMLDLIQPPASLPVRFSHPVGFSEAVNAGIKKAQMVGDRQPAYYVLYNQDIAVSDPMWLRHLIRWMEHRTDCVIAAPKLVYDDGTIENAGIDPTGPAGCAERGRRQPADAPAFNEYRAVPMVSGAVMAFKESCLTDPGLFDERYEFGCEDLAYCLRVSAQCGKEVWYVPDAVLTHSSHAVQAANPADIARVQAMHGRSQALYLREWGTYLRHLSKRTSVAFVLPDFHPSCGGARVVGALSRHFSICGFPSAVFVRTMVPVTDADYPEFNIQPISELKQASIVFATRFDTLAECERVQADKRYYLVQQIEDVMAKYCGAPEEQARASYLNRNFEIITIGDHLVKGMEALGRSGGVNVLDVGLYIDLYPYRARRAPQRPFRVLMYGCDQPHKGPDNAEIAEQIRRYMGSSVVINTFHRGRSQQSWADNHFQPQSTSEVARVYSEHDCYVYASESDGFAMTPVEAMACGTPVVLTDFPGKDQYAVDNENCLIAPFRDAKRVAQLVNHLANHHPQWAALSRAGRAVAEQYDWGQVCRQYVQLMLGVAL